MLITQNELELGGPSIGSSNHIIGRLLVDAGRLQPADADRVADAQRALGLRFGETAVKLGILTDTDVRLALSAQYGYKYLQPGQGNFSTELMAAYSPFTPQAEALRKLRTELLLRWFNPDHKLLALVSTAQGDGRSYLCANLGVAFAQLGESTLLVDCNMRTPRLHKIFNCDDSIGLSTILASRATSYLDGIAAVPALPSLYVLPAGPIPPNPLELLAQPTFVLLLAFLAERFEIVLIDTPSASAHADAQVVAARAGGALMVVRRDRTRTADLKTITEAVAASATPIVGTVMNHR